MFKPYFLPGINMDRPVPTAIVLSRALQSFSASPAGSHGCGWRCGPGLKPGCKALLILISFLAGLCRSAQTVFAFVATFVSQYLSRGGGYETLSIYDDAPECLNVFIQEYQTLMCFRHCLHGSNLAHSFHGAFPTRSRVEFLLWRVPHLNSVHGGVWHCSCGYLSGLIAT